METVPSLLRNFLNLSQISRDCLIFHITNNQSLSVNFRARPKYLNIATPYTRARPSPLYRMNFISSHLLFMYTSLHLSHIFISLLYISVYMYLISLAAGICIPQRSHLGSSSGPSCIISTLYLKFQYIKYSLSLSEFFAVDRNPSTRHTTNFITRRKEILYVYCSPLPMSTPQVCGRTIQFPIFVTTSIGN